MHSHRLILEGDPRDAEWLLEWDDERFILKNPDDQPVFEAVASYAHRVVELYELYAEGKISFAAPNGSLVFEKNAEALVELREFVEAQLGSDTDYRNELRRQSLRAIPLGLAMFFVAGGVFGLYCWYASWAADPPPGHWVRLFGWLIYGVLLLLLVTALAGLAVCYFGLRQWMRLRRIERSIAVRAAEKAVTNPT